MRVAKQITDFLPLTKSKSLLDDSSGKWSNLAQPDADNKKNSKKVFILTNCLYS